MVVRSVSSWLSEASNNNPRIFASWLDCLAAARTLISTATDLSRQTADLWDWTEGEESRLVMVANWDTRKEEDDRR